MGCNQWSISGGEPMLRPDFAELFDFLTRKAVSFSLNTNGSLITPSIAELLVRKGIKLVALYGADTKIHDHITRTPGSFEEFLRGCAYLKEAGAGFTVQIIPMRNNYDQLSKMFQLARRLSPSYRIGASWLYLSAQRRPGINREIIRQRLTPQEVVAIDPAIPSSEETAVDCGISRRCESSRPEGDRLLWPCIMERQEFHIDPYGMLSFCPFSKDPSLRIDLGRFSFQEAWDEALPRIARRVRGGAEYRTYCGSCDSRSTCHWCGAYAYLEHGRISAPVKYLCDIARERQKFNLDWVNNHRRFFRIAGITVQVDSDLPMTSATFDKRFIPFETEKPGKDIITISHHFSLPDFSILKQARRVYKRSPWEIYQKDSAWIYLGLGPGKNHSQARLLAVFNSSHSHAEIYHKDGRAFRAGHLGSLTTFPSDLIMLSHALAERQGFYFHSSGLVLNGHGLLFVGPSGAGKSTIVKLLGEYGNVLCDDRVIVRRWPDGFWVHGTWSHGEIPRVSSGRAPLRAIFFLKKAKINRLVPMEDKREVLHSLMFRIVRPLCTPEWWQSSLSLLSVLSQEVPAYRLEFTKDRRVLGVLSEIVGPLVFSPPEPIRPEDAGRPAHLRTRQKAEAPAYRKTDSHRA